MERFRSQLAVRNSLVRRTMAWLVQYDVTNVLKMGTSLLID